MLRDLQLRCKISNNAGLLGVTEIGSVRGSPLTWRPAGVVWSYAYRVLYVALNSRQPGRDVVRHQRDAGRSASVGSAIGSDETSVATVSYVYGGFGAWATRPQHAIGVTRDIRPRKPFPRDVTIGFGFFGDCGHRRVRLWSPRLHQA